VIFLPSFMLNALSIRAKFLIKKQVTREGLDIILKAQLDPPKSPRAGKRIKIRAETIDVKCLKNYLFQEKSA